MSWKGLLPTALTVLLVGAAPAAAETYTVTGFGDEPMECSGTVCPTLSAAVTVANADPALDTIVLPAGDYTLSQGSLSVYSEIAIVGANARSTIIHAASGTSVFWVDWNGTLTLSHVTLDGGGGYQGGNLLTWGTTTLDHVRVIGGFAGDGDGGGILNRGTLTIRHSYIAQNATIGVGGAVATQYYEGPASTTISDSTIAGNSSSSGGAVSVSGPASATLERVTIVGNSAPEEFGATGGVYVSEGGTMVVRGSIVAGNTVGTVPDDCGGVITSEPGNISTSPDCGFELAGVVPSQLLSEEPDASGETEVYPLAAGSPALDRYTCTGDDQRLVVRPQGSACDSGAYEVVVTVPEPTPTPTPVVTPTPTPTPTFNRTVVVEPERGTIRIRVPGSRRFVTLTGDMSIPFGTIVDAKRGRVELTSLPTRGGKPETAIFYGGIFRVARSGGYTELRLTEALAPCASARRASAAATKPKTRKLWGNGKGKFRTKGRYSAATVRGTRWLVEDGCRYTRTRVTQGSVSVRDAVRKRTIIVRKNRSYTARPR